MIRSSFKRPTLERVRTVHTPVPQHLRRNASMTPVAPRIAAIVKFEYVRSRPLLNAIKSLPCQHCGACAPSDPAHSNSSCHGKGKAIKASDVFCAALCRSCHRLVDESSKLTQEERMAIWYPAWRNTVRLLLRNGTWPTHIPIPDIRSMN
jgi:hypothetical protein